MLLIRSQFPQLYGKLIIRNEMWTSKISTNYIVKPKNKNQIKPNISLIGLNSIFMKDSVLSGLDRVLMGNSFAPNSPRKL